MFALRQAFAEFASGKILRRFAEARIGDAKGATSRGVSCASGKSFACSAALDCENMAVDQRSWIAIQTVPQTASDSAARMAAVIASTRTR
ncbi:hypothetical protein BJS_01597 [Bradyrhizobium japonicum SEMIA 5079]|nr:hypothetical protein BJS_01597 [Bradyrhizobium japonicum SEMIA 5079]